MRSTWAIGHGPAGDFVSAPIRAFEPISPGQINETYPLLKKHVVVVVGTKTECSQGVRLIHKEQRRVRNKISLPRALELLAEINHEKR